MRKNLRTLGIILGLFGVYILVPVVCLWVTGDDTVRGTCVAWTVADTLLFAASATALGWSRRKGSAEPESPKGVYSGAALFSGSMVLLMALVALAIGGGNAVTLLSSIRRGAGVDFGVLFWCGVQVLAGCAFFGKAWQLLSEY